MDYISRICDEIQPRDKQSTANKPDKPACFLCEAGQTDVEADPELAEKRLVLWQDHRGALLLNRYPYSSGHLLVTPHAHVGDLTDLSAEQRANLMELIVLGQQLLTTTYNPQGFNVGMNLGRAAGAGVPGHMHIHIVPRWTGDANFMTTVAGLRVTPQAIEHTYEWLRQAMAKI